MTYLNCDTDGKNGGDLDYNATWPATSDRHGEELEHSEEAYRIADAMMDARDAD